MPIKSYPHYEVNVKDNSIYNFVAADELPVHRALWVLPTQKGPADHPVWVKNRQQFDRIFGPQTLDLGTKDYKTPLSYWLHNLFQLNGQFIMRALPKDQSTGKIAAKKATSVLYARVKHEEMAAILCDEDGNAQTVQDDITQRATSITADFSTIKETADFGKYAIEPETVETSQVDVYLDKITGAIRYSNANGQWYEGNGDSELSTVSADALKNLVKETKFFHDITPATRNGISIQFFTRVATEEQMEAIEEETILSSHAFDKEEHEGYTDYPILCVAANYYGIYGNDFAYRFFANAATNNGENVAWNRSVFNSLGVAYKDHDTIVNIFDANGKNAVEFSADPNCVDRETSIRKDMEAVVEKSYDETGESGDEFPFMLFSFEENLNIIGKAIIEAENRNMAALGLTNMNFESYEDFENDFGEDKVGYAINVLGGINAEGNPYPHVKYANGESYSTEHFIVVTDSDVSERIRNGSYPVAGVEVDEYGTGTDTIVKLDKNTYIYLTGGNEGTDFWQKTNDPSSGVDPSFLDKAMYDFVTLKLDRTIVDKFRFPFTHLYDIGYSMTTKFAMEDFLDIRDDVGVELTTQVLLSSRWATGFDRKIKWNTISEDNDNVVVLRERALMMRESVLKNTDTMRCSIYTQAGVPVDVTLVNVANNLRYQVKENQIIPYVYWSAYQHAMYGNLPVMSKQEPRGLPYSANTLFKNYKWVPHFESEKEKIWNIGANYCQYGDMTLLFYPALRTVYRNDTSILTDQWDVDALIYTKHVCRKAWAQFSGRNDRVGELQDAIKKYLDSELAKLYNGKFDFTVEVYQTEEEQNYGYIQHVKLTITFPATLRVLIFDIEVNREGYTPAE